jgi:hypothetical protein
MHHEGGFSPSPRLCRDVHHHLRSSQGVAAVRAFVVRRRWSRGRRCGCSTTRSWLARAGVNARLLPFDDEGGRPDSGGAVDPTCAGPGRAALGPSAVDHAEMQPGLRALDSPLQVVVFLQQPPAAGGARRAGRPGIRRFGLAGCPVGGYCTASMNEVFSTHFRY